MTESGEEEEEEEDEEDDEEYQEDEECEDEEETKARAEVMFGHYTGIVDIEAKCMVDMINKHVLPSAKAAELPQVAALEAALDTLGKAIEEIHASSGKPQADLARTLRLETMIDIRNERMRELVFKNSPTATVSATVDMVALDKLGVGESMVTETEGTLSLLGQEVAIYSDLFVIRVGEDKVMVTTDGMLMLATDELGVDAAIDQLQDIAGLDSITRVSPVTVRLVFDSDTPGS